MKSRITTAVVSIAALGLVAAPAAMAEPQRDSDGAGRAGHKIVGGSTTDISSFPYQVAVLDEDTNAQYCGGSLIRPRVVLTAAHCIFPPSTFLADTGVLLDTDYVVANTTDWTIGGQESRIDDFAVHPSYSAATGADGGFDVALFLLRDPIAPANLVQLAGPDEARLWRQGDFANVSGWGHTSEGGTGSTILKSATVPIISDAECPSYYGGAFNPATMVCAGFPSGGTDACQGDSGGPLTVAAFGGEGGFVRQVGTVSWGAGCARPFAPGVYARAGQDPIQGFIQGQVNSWPDPGDVIGSGGDRCVSIRGKSRKKKKQRALCACQEDKFGKARKKCVKKVKRKFSRRKKKK